MLLPLLLLICLIGVGSSCATTQEPPEPEVIEIVRVETVMVEVFPEVPLLFIERPEFPEDEFIAVPETQEDLVKNFIILDGYTADIEGYASDLEKYIQIIKDLVSPKPGD